MRGLIFAYDRNVGLDEIPVVSPACFRDELIECIDENWRLLAMFGMSPDGSGTAICAILGLDAELCVLRTGNLEHFDSIAVDCPQAQLFEREIYEQWGILPHGHPWLKSVRESPDSVQLETPYPFYAMQGPEVHEVGVGPVHAGIIEPGHFRFQCYGENVLNLEICLGYQHRGIEEKLLRLPANPRTSQLRLRLVECIAGDASVAHATAQCILWERLLAEGMTPVSLRSQYLRRVGLELERLACHCGDLGAIAGDTGFLPTSSWNGRIRGDFLNMTAIICGNRFGREYLDMGGVVPTLSSQDCEMLIKRLEDAGKDAIGSCEVMFHTASVRDRLANTGKLSSQQASSLGLVGVAARACGLGRDARYVTPASELPLYNCQLRVAHSGDVLARSRVRYQEMKDSLTMVGDDLVWLLEHPLDSAPPTRIAMRLPARRLAVAQVESWRGEICHVGITGDDGNFLVNKFYDPSFHNWPGLALAMRDGQISDFPLCNKSFNLSYCGNDL